MHEKRVNEYIEGKYGKLGVDWYITKSSVLVTELSLHTGLLIQLMLLYIC